MKHKSENRNRFDSVALTSRLEGFIPWFWAPKAPPPAKSHMEGLLHVKAVPTVYISKRRVVLHGLERSGTGFCDAILSKNLYHTDVDSVFKHTAFDSQRDGSSCNILSKYIIVTRNPYSWVLSYEKYHINRAYDPTLIDGRLTYDYCERGNRCCYMEVWNSVYRKWLEEIPKLYDYATVKYEDLLQFPKETLMLLSLRLNLDLTEEFTGVDRYLNNYSGHSVGPNGSFTRRDYYLKKEYMHSFTRESLATINKCLDVELMRKLGYSLET